MPNCWELDEIFSSSIATGEMAFQGGDLKDRFPGEWKEREPTGGKPAAKAIDTPSTTLLLTRAVEEFRASHAAMGSTIQQVVRRVRISIVERQGGQGAKLIKLLIFLRRKLWRRSSMNWKLILNTRSTG